MFIINQLMNGENHPSADIFQQIWQFPTIISFFTYFLGLFFLSVPSGMLKYMCVALLNIELGVTKVLFIFLNHCFLSLL